MKEPEKIKATLLGRFSLIPSSQQLLSLYSAPPTSVAVTMHIIGCGGVASLPFSNVHIPTRSFQKRAWSLLILPGIVLLSLFSFTLRLSHLSPRLNTAAPRFVSIPSFA